MTGSIHDAAPSDIPDIAAFFAEDRRVHEPAVTAAEVEADLREELARPHARLLVVRARVDLGGGLGELVGALLAWHVADEVTVLDVVVSEARRREGHGRALVRELLRRARAEGARLAILEVRVGNAPARGLYRALGFDEVRVRRGYYADGEDGVEMHATLEADG